MKEDQIRIAANLIAGLAEVSGCPIDEILEALSGCIFSEEDCGEILERFNF